MTRTISQLGDEAIARSRRFDRRTNIEAMVNATIRECHASPQKEGQAILYDKNLVEVSVAIDVASTIPFIWTPPNTMQKLMTVRYPSVFDSENEPIFPDFIRPGRRQRNEDSYYYRVGNQYAFKGHGGTSENIEVAYYNFPTRLQYHQTVADRPAFYDEADGWTYQNVGGVDYDLDDTNRALGESLVSNWLIFDWYETVLEGVISKLYKAAGDRDRSVTHFSAFGTMRGTLMTTEESLDDQFPT